jgi:hypothetical protein
MDWIGLLGRTYSANHTGGYCTYRTYSDLFSYINCNLFQFSTYPFVSGQIKTILNLNIVENNISAKTFTGHNMLKLANDKKPNKVFSAEQVH